MGISLRNRFDTLISGDDRHGMRQLDLFNDTAPVQKANQVVEALLRRDWSALPGTLAELTKVDAEHHFVPKFERLCGLIHEWQHLLGAEEIAYESCCHLREVLNSALTSLADDLMGDVAADWIRPFWGELAEKFERMGGRGKEEGAEAYLKAQRWSDVLRMANAFSGKEMRPSVQRWLCLGYLALGHRDEATQSLLRFSWLSPDCLECLIQETSFAPWAQCWRGFQRNLGELDNDWFPAWYLHEFRPLEWRFEAFPQTSAARGYQILLGLLRSESRGIDRTLMADRAKLKNLCPEFFAFYLRHR
jgi:hypothetical protein